MMLRLLLAILCISCAPAYADPPPPHVLVVGDSLSAQNVWPSLLSEHTGVDVTLEAAGGRRWRDYLLGGVDLASVVEGAEPSHVVVLLGTNDVWASNPDAVGVDAALEDAADVLAIIHRAAPRACVAVLTLPGPADGSTEAWAETHAAYNKALETLGGGRVDVVRTLVSPTRFRDPVHLHRDAEYAIAATVAGWLWWGCK